MERIDDQLNFVIISQQPWDTELGSNCKNIALELSKRYNVLYVNSPLDRISLFKGLKNEKVKKRLSVIRRQTDGLIQIAKGLWTLYPDCIVESINWVPSNSFFDILNKRNNKKLSKSIQKALKMLSFDKFILLNDNEMFKAFYLKEFLSPEVYAYYSRDFMIAVDYWKRHGVKFEPLLIEKSDLCFANSTYLADYCRKFNGRSYYIGQGCDISDFKNEGLKKPEELKNLNGVLIGYVGALNSQRLDLEIIENIAINFPDYNIVLVGPEDETFNNSFLHTMENIHFLGQKPVDALPAYVSYFDVCINPQKVNEITIGNYPRKIDEYLAAGKPTVATSTMTMEVFKEHVYLAGSKEEYITQIQRAIIENNASRISQRINFVSTHTWENSVQLMMNEISNFLNDKNN